MIIQNASQQPNASSESKVTQESVTNRHAEITSQCEQCMKITQETENQLQKVCRLQEYMMITRSHLEVYSKLAESGQLSQEQRQQWQSEAAKHQEYENNLVTLRKEIIKNHEKIINIMQELHGQVVYTETRSLERSQAAAYNGAPQYSTLEQLEQWYQSLATIIWKSLRQLVHLEGQPIPIRDGQNPLPNMKSSYVSFLGSLVERGLVIEKQPPQVLMKDKRFVGTLRHLVGDKLDIHKVAFQVRAHLVSDENARRILAKGEFIGSGKIVNHTVMTEYHEHSRILQANFRNMTLRDKGRGDRRGTESVAEEKFAIVFQADIVVRSPACEFTVTAQTLSLPVVVISHGKQEANAAATIFWDNAFSEDQRVPYQVPERVSWGRFMEAVDFKWQSECRTKVGLKQRARDYLASKIFGRAVPDGQDFCWRQLNRDNIPGHNFTFWQWLYSVLELTKSRYIQPHWNQTTIEGFISKSECQSLLLSKGPGTFMLRFSDSKLGGISTAYVAKNDDGSIEVKHLEPDSLKILQVRSLADMVKDFSQLVKLFPDRPKHDAFSKFYTSKPVQDGPYVKKTLVAHIEES
ncbi:Oidioi.mRNA.OKI2018_I69.PAR.g9953.t1.cds [Oikopleura dioica]|nr:Oidioi.mRNA.OKI2018_I69.PAR.g9953.t1.cds [Oikopleura dioica]